MASLAVNGLTLEGNVPAAVRLVTEHAGGGVLDPDATTPSGQNSSIFLEMHFSINILSLVFHLLLFYPVVMLSLCEDIEVCVAHIQAVACRIQGGAVLGGCDAAHWHDVLICYGAHSGYLRDSVAAVAHRLSNSIASWDDVQALFAGHLITLDKCPGV